MECPRCHAQTREGLRFCQDCGGHLALACSQCGAQLGPGKRFCVIVRGTPSPESYTPKHLAEKILTSRAALEGERMNFQRKIIAELAARHRLPSMFGF
jgi:hypothetical protein